VSALAEALVAAQAELPCALGKDADGRIGQRSYRYLTLDKLIEATRPVLTKHGLALIQAPGFAERGEDGAMPILATRLLHDSGEPAGTHGNPCSGSQPKKTQTGPHPTRPQTCPSKWRSFGFTPPFRKVRRCSSSAT
jgi:hypothetical protein